jgi:hypothetical protein
MKIAKNLIRIPLSALCLTVITLTACGSDGESNTLGTARPLVVAANVNGATRASIADTWDGRELVALKIGSDTYQYRVTSSTDATLQSVVDGNMFYWQPVPSSYTVTAWSYGNSTDYSATPPTTFALNVNQNSGNKELLYVNNQAIYYSASRVPEVYFYHQLAKVVVNITYKTSTTISTITFGTDASKLPLTGNFTAPSEVGVNYGEWTFGENTGTIIPKTETANEKYSAILIPGDYSGKELFSITIADGTQFVYTVPGSLTLAPGNVYVYNIVVDDVKITFSGVQVTDWTTSRRNVDM